jgi:hypothetical protein
VFYYYFGDFIWFFPFLLLASCFVFFWVQNVIDFFSVFMLGYAWGIFLSAVVFRSNKVHHVRYSRLFVVGIEIYKFDCSLGRVCWSNFLATYLFCHHNHHHHHRRHNHNHHNHHLIIHISLVRLFAITFCRFCKRNTESIENNRFSLVSTDSHH